MRLSPKTLTSICLSALILLSSASSFAAEGDKQELHEAGIQLFDNGDRVGRHTTPFLEFYFGTDQKAQNRFGGAFGYRIRWDLSVSAVLEKQTLSGGASPFLTQIILDYLVKYNRPLVLGAGIGPAFAFGGSQIGYGGMGRMTLRYYLSSGFGLQIEGGYRYLLGLSQSVALASAGIHIDL